MKKEKLSFDDIHPVNLRLLDEQVKMILEALMLYGYNLEYMLNENDFKLEEKEISRKKTMFRCTYEIVRESLIEQIQTGEGTSNYDISKTENKIIDLIQSNKNITQIEIAKILNLSENCVYRNIKKLKEKNILIRIGTNKNGSWEIRDNFSNKFRDKSGDFDKIANI